MNKGFLMFSPGAGITMLKDEPDDLTHLAPTAGDACIPLENCPFEMFDEFILNDNYCSLLSDDLENGSPVDSLIADSLLSSPEPQETESSCEQSSLLTELSLDTFDGARSDNDIDDGTSPFIPTTDELPLLEPAVMWGALPESVRQARPQPSEPPSSAPALQRLLVAPPTGPPPQDIITNIYSDQGLIPSRSVSSWDQGVKRVMNEDEDNNAKRAKRSPSPQPKPQNTSSSVLMNLLDLEQQRREAVQKKFNYQLVPNSQKTSPTIHNTNIPLPVINIIQSEPNKQMMRANKSIATVPNIRANLTNAVSPLSVNIGPMYSPNYSPVVSPGRMDMCSPYSTPQSLSPNDYLYSPNSRLLSPSGVMQGYDPYLNKFQTSPGFSAQTTDLMEGNIPIASDFWTDSEMLQGTSDLMAAFDDVKLV